MWWFEPWLERRFETSNGEKIQQYVYVLEANLVFHNGLTLPLLSEFRKDAEGDTENHKQDCELNAFKRLVARLKKDLHQIPILVLLDGLYANGPVMEQCLNSGWSFMIVLQNNCLSSVWEEVYSLKQLQPKNRRNWRWKARQQHFWWVNDIVYTYGNNKELTIHVVVCEETWQEVDNQTAEIIDKQSRHVWISSSSLAWNNVHERCNLGARLRPGIENSMRTEKKQGYYYEHAFSHNWNAMKGFHYLMRMAHMMNAIALSSIRVAKQVVTMGIKAFLTFVRETCANPWLSFEWTKQFLQT
jgi:hypothetical protein